VRVSVGDVRLFFDVSGSGWAVDHEGLRNRPVLIGLHGGPGRDGSKHRYQLAQLADVAQVIVPDQRGHGRSDLGTPESWNLATWAADVKGLCDALGIERPVVFGSSFGGFVAQKYGAAFPEHPAGLILASTAARIVGGDELVERFRVVGGDEAAEVTRRDIEAPTLETQADWIRVCGPLLRLNEVSDAYLSVVDAARIETMEVNLRWFETEAMVMDLRADLANVRCPTLVLVGEHDPLNPIYTGEEIVAAIPNGLARLEVIADAAHELMTDNPEHTSRCIRQFLADIAQPL
jgi:pimeloyl-ACP methyl ester carboxylesterase